MTDLDLAIAADIDMDKHVDVAVNLDTNIHVFLA